MKSTKPVRFIPRIHGSRLLALADFLDRLPRHRFNFEIFVGADWEGAQDLSCGTTACGLGWAATIPRFRRLGLKLKREREGLVYPQLGELGGLDAAKIIFGLSYSESSLLFVPSFFSETLRFGYVEMCSLKNTATPAQLARHLRRFVRFKTAAMQEGARR